MELSRHDAILLTCNNVFFDRLADVELCCLGGYPPSSDHGAIQLTVLPKEMCGSSTVLEG